MKLYYFDASNPGMGFVPASTLTTDTSYSVVVNAGDILSINGENEPQIYFTQGQKYLFEQSDATNQEYRLTFPYYDTGSGTWIDTNTGITPHGVPGRNGAYTYFEPDALADLTRVCLVKDGVRKTTLIAPIVTIEDISFGVLGKAYGGIPFTVTFTSGINDGSFSITDVNGAAVALTSPTATDLSYGTSSIEVTIGTDVLSGVMTIGGTNGITQTFDYEAFAQTFVVTIGQVSGSDVFLIDGASNVDLGLENGKSYMFDLSYSENYTFGLATEIDGANSSAYTDNIVNVSNYMIVQDVSASSTLYYYAVGYSNMGKLPPQWVQKGTTITDSAAGDQFGGNVRLSSDGSRIAVNARYNDDGGIDFGRVRTYDFSGNDWTQVGSDIYGSNSGEFMSLDLSTDGNTLAIGSGLYGRYNATDRTGKVTIYDFSGNDWVQRGSVIFPYADANGITANDRFGTSVSLSSNANTIAIGAPQDDTNYSNAGSVTIYDFNGNDWVQRGDKMFGTYGAKNEKFGIAVSLSADGNKVLIGASGEKYVYLYEWTTQWSKIHSYSSFGQSISLSADGNVYALGLTSTVVTRNFINNKGVNMDYGIGGSFGKSVSLTSDGFSIAISNPTDDTNGTDRGLVQTYQYNSTDNTWSQYAETLYGDTDADQFGTDIKISPDGSTMVVGAPYNSSGGYVKVFEYK